MTLDELAEKNVAIIGLGKEGLTTAKYLYSHGVKDITICDQRSESDLKEEIHSLPLKPKTILGGGYLQNLSQFDVCFRSPGVMYSKPEIQSAIKAGVDVYSGTRLFFDLCPAKIIAVTGTKGKGTTSSLLTGMLKGAGDHEVWLGGNIGIPPLEFLDNVKKEDLVVLELSSFQLQDLDKAPDYYIILNLYRDHLDAHRDFNEYSEAKLHIAGLLKPSNHLIINDNLRAKTANSRAKVHTFGLGAVDTSDLDARLIRDDEGGYSGVISQGQDIGQTKISFDKTKLTGEHNFLNCIAAGLCANLLGVPAKHIQDTINNLKPLEHRLEFVREIKGVRYINDSLATVPESAVEAIKSFNSPVLLIAGGSSKGADYQVLAESVKKLGVKASILIGQSKKDIHAALTREGLSPNEIFETDTLDHAVRKAYEIAVPGDVVVLSPACASFGMFKNYSERGDAYKKIVNGL
jgi:UDP-N-acetylmuramoylalanine--D-glutamate ligase